MRKLLFITTIILFGLIETNAQDKDSLEFGTNIGLSMANVINEYGNESVSRRITFNAGLFGEYYITDNWGIKAKFIYGVINYMI